MSYLAPSLSLMPLYRSDVAQLHQVMNWQAAGAVIKRALQQDGFNVDVFPLEEKEEQIIFGILILEDRFSLPYYKRMFEKNLTDLASPEVFSITESPDGSRAFFCEIKKEPNKSLELRSALENEEVVSSPSRLTVPLGLAFVDSVETLDLRFFSCIYMHDREDQMQGLFDVFMTALLMRARPDDVRFVFIGQNRRFDQYSVLPHMYRPIIKEEAQADAFLNGMRQEIITRLNTLEESGMRSLDGYNASLRVEEKPFLRLLIVLDPFENYLQKTEFATLLRMIREHGALVGVHLMIVCEDVLSSVLMTKNTIRFRRAIDAETDNKQLVKVYTVQRGDHVQHFMNCCFLEAVDVEHIISFIADNNDQVLIETDEEEAEEASKETGNQEPVHVDLVETESQPDIELYSFSDQDGNTEMRFNERTISSKQKDKPETKEEEKKEDLDAALVELLDFSDIQSSDLIKSIRVIRGYRKTKKKNVQMPETPIPKKKPTKAQVLVESFDDTDHRSTLTDDLDLANMSIIREREVEPEETLREAPKAEKPIAEVPKSEEKTEPEKEPESSKPLKIQETVPEKPLPKAKKGNGFLVVLLALLLLAFALCVIATQTGLLKNASVEKIKTTITGFFERNKESAVEPEQDEKMEMVAEKTAAPGDENGEKEEKADSRVDETAPPLVVLEPAGEVIEPLVKETTEPGTVEPIPGEDLKASETILPLTPGNTRAPEAPAMEDGKTGQSEKESSENLDGSGGQTEDTDAGKAPPVIRKMGPSKP